MTRERPILFSAPMVRAILAGTKTQTRRAMRQQPPEGVQDFATFHNPRGDGLAHFAFDPVARELQEWFAVCPYGQPGDRIWVREAWKHIEGGPVYDAAGGVADSFDPETIYRASRPKYPGPWKPSIHMPRWASRINLEITGVRLERLQDISEDDARAEGARECDPVSGREVLLAGPSQRGSFVLHYRDIWEQINGPGSWEANPWVWVVEFKRVTS